MVYLIICAVFVNFIIEFCLILDFAYRMEETSNCGMWYDDGVRLCIPMNLMTHIARECSRAFPFEYVDSNGPWKIVDSPIGHRTSIARRWQMNHLTRYRILGISRHFDYPESAGKCEEEKKHRFGKQWTPNAENKTQTSSVNCYKCM